MAISMVFAHTIQTELRRSGGSFTCEEIAVGYIVQACVLVTCTSHVALLIRPLHS